MARGSSYYDKVYPRLLATAEGKALLDRIKNRLNAINAVSYHFNVTRGTGTAEDSMVVTYAFQYSTEDGSVAYRQTFDAERLQSIQTEYVRIDAAKFVGDDPEQVVHTRLGDGVPTFNCLKSTCLDGKSYSYRSNKDDVLSFSDWFWERVRELPEYKAAQERICKQIRKFRRSKEFDQDKREAQAQFACESIKDIMMRYSWLGDDTMKRAVQTWVIGEILES